MIPISRTTQLARLGNVLFHVQCPMSSADANALRWQVLAVIGCSTARDTRTYLEMQQAPRHDHHPVLSRQSAVSDPSPTIRGHRLPACCILQHIVFSSPRGRPPVVAPSVPPRTGLDRTRHCLAPARALAVCRNTTLCGQYSPQRAQVLLPGHQDHQAVISSTPPGAISTTHLPRAGPPATPKESHSRLVCPYMP